MYKVNQIANLSVGHVTLRYGINPSSSRKPSGKALRKPHHLFDHFSQGASELMRANHTRALSVLSGMGTEWLVWRLAE